VSACGRPAPWETLVAYYAGDLPAEEESALEEHLFACAACSREAARVASVTESLRGMIPAVLTREKLAELRAKGVRAKDTAIAPGERREEHFPGDLDLLIVHLQGLTVPEGARVSVIVRARADEKAIVAMYDAPYDAGSGELLVCCQRHFAALPSDIVFDVEVEGEGAAVAKTRYALQHHFD
jgi:hypothetical protein